jgi:hypothetical protein
MEAVLVALSGRLFDQKLKALIKACILTHGCCHFHCTPALEEAP